MYIYIFLFFISLAEEYRVLTINNIDTRPPRQLHLQQLLTETNERQREEDEPSEEIDLLLLLYEGNLFRYSGAMTSSCRSKLKQFPPSNIYVKNMGEDLVSTRINIFFSSPPRRKFTLIKIPTFLDKRKII